MKKMEKFMKSVLKSLANTKEFSNQNYIKTKQNLKYLVIPIKFYYI